MIMCLLLLLLVVVVVVVCLLLLTPGPRMTTRPPSRRPRRPEEAAEAVSDIKINMNKEGGEESQVTPKLYSLAFLCLLCSQTE